MKMQYFLTVEYYPTVRKYEIMMFYANKWN